MAKVEIDGIKSSIVMARFRGIEPILPDSRPIVRFYRFLLAFDLIARMGEDVIRFRYT